MDLKALQNVRQLAQSSPPNTNAYSVLNKSAKRKVVVTSVLVDNFTTAAATYSMYLDKDGTTYSNATALFSGIVINGNTTVLHEFLTGLPVDFAATAGNLAIQSNTANALTFTVNGIEVAT